MVDHLDLISFIKSMKFSCVLPDNAVGREIDYGS